MRADGPLAGGAGRARHHQVEAAGSGHLRQGRAGVRGREHSAHSPAPLALQHDRHAVDHHVQEAARRAAPARRTCAMTSAGNLQRETRDQTTAPSLKIGRYIAMTRPPTSTPRIAMISGSSKLDMASTALSTSAS